jgi:enoyl-CoA hydratase
VQPVSAAGVRTAVSGPLLIITLNRPGTYNAFNRDQAESLAAAIDRLEAEPELRAAVLTGAGGRFCAGTDLRAAATGESVEVAPRGYYGMLEMPPRKPIVAAVEGAAVGGGCELMLACDLTVAARSAQFGFPEVKRGLVAAGGALARLPSRVPFHVALDLLLTGRTFGVEEASRWGLVARIVDDGEALDAAIALATEIAANGPVAVAATKEGVVAASYEGEAAAWERSRELARRITRSADFEEGIAAFFEKREPRWTGR